MKRILLLTFIIFAIHAFIFYEVFHSSKDLDYSQVIFGALALFSAIVFLCQLVSTIIFYKNYYFRKSSIKTSKLTFESIPLITERSREMEDSVSDASENNVEWTKEYYGGVWIVVVMCVAGLLVIPIGTILVCLVFKLLLFIYGLIPHISITILLLVLLGPLAVLSSNMLFCYSMKGRRRKIEKRYPNLQDYINIFTSKNEIKLIRQCLEARVPTEPRPASVSNPLTDDLPAVVPTKKDNDFVNFARFYLHHGFTLSKICGKDYDEPSWKADVSHFYSDEDLELLNDSACTGIGAMLGYGSNIRALDFDNLNPNIMSDIQAHFLNLPQRGHLRRFLTHVLSLLGLPADYPWVVISGSHRGLHIIFRTEGPRSGLYFSACGLCPIGDSKVYERVELRWRCHLVLPPSMHYNLGEQAALRYTFIHRIPSTDLPVVPVESLQRFLNADCGKPYVVNSKCWETGLPYVLRCNTLNYSRTSSGEEEEILRCFSERELAGWLQECHDQDSLNTLGMFYALGIGVSTNMQMAKQCFLQSGSTEAIWNLVMLMSSGRIEATHRTIVTLLQRVKHCQDVRENMVLDNLAKLFGPQAIESDQPAFNPEQQAVINFTSGHHLVLAPPGCGKTRVLAERVLKAIEEGRDTKDMLCLTFTNKAARDMRTRILERMGQSEIDGLMVGNVHHFCSIVLRKHKVITQRTTIIDEVESKSIILSIHKQNDKAKGSFDSDLLLRYHQQQHQLQHHYPKDLVVQMDSIPEESKLEYQRVSREYSSYKKRYDLVDFDDLLLMGYDYLVSHREEVKHYGWIQIDEVQDLNQLQFAIIDLVMTAENSCVVYLGDEQQAIYSFMGAKLESLALLKTKCNGRIHHFYANYRSPQFMLDVFNRYAVDTLGVDPALLPQSRGKNATMPAGEESLLIETCHDREAQYEMDYDSIQMAVDRAKYYLHNTEGRVAILTHSNEYADKISQRLNEYQLSHFMIAGTDFMWTKEMKLLLAHLNVFVQPENLMSWSRILVGINAISSIESANEFMLKAHSAYLLGSDLIVEKRHTLIKDFVGDYPNELIIFDTETTGLDIANDDIVEIAAVRVRGGVIVDKFDEMFITDKVIPLKLGDIDNPLPDVYKKRTKLGRYEGLTKFLDWVGDAPILAHNANFDVNILDANLRRDCDIDDLKQRWTNIYDSLKLARIIAPKLTSYKLKDLLTEFGLKGVNSHLAIDDVRATKNLVDYCFQKACPIFVLQNSFLAEHREVIEYIREAYANLYRHTESSLSVRQMGNPLVQELEFAYRYFKEKGYMGELNKIEYLKTFLQNDLIVEIEDVSLLQLLQKYMMDINTLREADLCDCESLKKEILVFVSTVHRAKGLEFENVIVTSCYDDVYPNWYVKKTLLDNQDQQGIQKAMLAKQESARQLYVAITRAKQKLCIQYPCNKTGFGINGWYSFPAQISPFLQCVSPMFAKAANDSAKRILP